MSCITEINKRTLERVKEEVDWLSYPVRISIDKGGEIHIVLSVRMGDSAHYSLHSDRQEDPVVKFIDTLVPDGAKFMSITFKNRMLLTRSRLRIGMTVWSSTTRGEPPPSTSVRS